MITEFWKDTWNIHLKRLYEETEGVGRIEVSGTNKKCIDDAMRMIKAIVAVPEVGEVYKGKVRSIMPYGAFVEFLPGKDGLLHISEIDWKRLETIEEAGLKEGDEIEVKLLDIDPKTGKFKLLAKYCCLVLKDKKKNKTIQLLYKAQSEI